MLQKRFSTVVQSKPVIAARPLLDYFERDQLRGCAAGWDVSHFGNHIINKKTGIEDHQLRDTSVVCYSFSNELVIHDLVNHNVTMIAG